MIKIKYLSFSLLLIFFFTSCSGNSGDVLHPSPEQIQKVEGLPNSISIDTTITVDWNMASNPVDSLTITNKQLSDGGAYSHVIDSEAGPDGLVYVALAPENVIRIFDKDSLVNQTGGSGRGPGEFIRLHDIHIDHSTNKLYALDQHEIEVFDIKNKAVDHQESITINSNYSDNICTIGDYLFINGSVIGQDSSESSFELTDIKASGPIHRVNLKDQRLESFGKQYLSVSNYGVFDTIISRTLISCNESTNTVTGIFRHLPHIIGYDANTLSVKWEAGLTDYDYSYQKEVVTRGAPTLNNVKYDKIKDRYFDLISLENEKALLQIGYDMPYEMSLSSLYQLYKSDSLKWRNILIDTRNGELSKAVSDTNQFIYMDNSYSIQLLTTMDPDKGPGLLINEYQ